MQKDGHKQKYCRFFRPETCNSSVTLPCDRLLQIQNYKFVFKLTESDYLQQFYLQSGDFYF